MRSERRVHTPARKEPTKRKLVTVEDEPDTKKIILGDLTDDEETMPAADSLQARSDMIARKEDERIVSLAIQGRNLQDMCPRERESPWLFSDRPLRE